MTDLEYATGVAEDVGTDLRERLVGRTVDQFDEKRVREFVRKQLELLMATHFIDAYQVDVSLVGTKLTVNFK